MKETQLLTKIKKHLVMKIGTNLYICETKNIEGTNKIAVSLGVSVPRIIYDDRIQKQYIKFIKFDNIYTIEYELDNLGNVQAVANPKVIFDKFLEKEKRLRFNVENIILDEIYPKLIKISLIKNNLRPIYVILNKIFFDKKFTQNDLNNSPKKERMKKYLKFLEDYGIIRKNSQGDFVEGNIPIELQKALENKKEMEVLEYTFGYVLKDGRKYLREELHLTMIDTFISIVTTYYYLASNIGKLIQISNATFFDEFKELYSKEVNNAKFLGYLTELQSANVLNKRDNLYYGEGSILQKLSSIA